MDCRVFMAPCASYEPKLAEERIRQALDAFGGPKALLQKGNRVLIKPNLLTASRPEAGVTAHPALVEAAARQFVQAGAQVVIADSPGGPYNRRVMEKVYQACGMDQAAERSGAELNWDFSSRKRRFPGRVRQEFQLVTPADRADVIVSIGKLKTHMMMYFTGAVKNLYGLIPGVTKAAYHSQHSSREDFADLLVDLCQAIQPDFSILDGVIGMDGKGPSAGRPRQAGAIFAAQNPFAADLAAMIYCGLNPTLAPVHRQGQAQGLAPEDWGQLDILGQALTPLAEPFAPAIPARHARPFVAAMPHFLQPKLDQWLGAWPRFTSQCVGCGACVKACPRQALQIKQGRVRLKKRRCIKCYCCHELCPQKAVDL
jgi:uncharacterized protein (DUF362 family)/ferredoxin